MTATLEKDPSIKQMLSDTPPIPPDLIVDEGEHLPDPMPVRVTVNVREDTWGAVRDITQLISQQEGQPLTVTQVVNRLLKDAIAVREEFVEEKIADPEAKLIIESARGRKSISNSFFELGSDVHFPSERES